MRTAQAGVWSDGTTWEGGTVPTASDDVTIAHDVTLTASASCASLALDGGGLAITGDLPDAGIILTVAGTVTYSARTGDATLVRMDGGRLKATPCISCEQTAKEPTGTLTQDHDRIIIDDAGPIGISATMEDMKPEGSSPAWARRVSNSVRYQTIRVHIRADCLGIVGRLMRMADQPYQVLAVTDSAVIKGYIENLAPVSDQGKEYIAYNVTIAEGRRWTRAGT